MTSQLLQVYRHDFQINVVHSSSCLLSVTSYFNVLEQEALIARCLEAFEDCAQRFPEHYKSLYRLAHFYFRSKSSCNVDKARQLLLGESGLFANRKASNFFNVSIL